MALKQPPLPNSALYTGTLRHRRHGPRAHSFAYPMFLFLLDLDELDAVDGVSRWLSVGRRNLVEFRRSDYHGDPAGSLAAAVCETVLRHSGIALQGPVRLLTGLRCLGHCFNPVSFYYCYERDGVTLAAVMAEITNTPWRERHAYVLPVGQAQRRGPALTWEFDKRFHVSPFIPMDRRYAWRLAAPGSTLRVHMDVLDGRSREFDATLVLQRRPFDAVELHRCIRRFPAMGLQTLWGIHRQALSIWLKRNPVYDHPSAET